ncbi:Fic family protein [Bacillus alkalicellulosilyticus]|uniref:Fic family protein n=1 Tax=Alkalihalobacterium alkalicellulosilyticum TaxID=1912214 RepID=UPI001FEAA73D|nr:Fic family protein [Bacillus alkalicellulosilyticus]
MDSYFQDAVSKSLKKQNYLKGLKKQEFAQKAAALFAEVNAVHPFREGNGRAQREFFRCLALANGYTLHWEFITEEEMIQASKQSAIGSIAGLNNIFERVIRVVPGTTRIDSNHIKTE